MISPTILPTINQYKFHVIHILIASIIFNHLIHHRSKFVNHLYPIIKMILSFQSMAKLNKQHRLLLLHLEKKSMAVLNYLSKMYALFVSIEIREIYSLFSFEYSLFSLYKKLSVNQILVRCTINSSKSVKVQQPMSILLSINITAIMLLLNK